MHLFLIQASQFVFIIIYTTINCIRYKYIIVSSIVSSVSYLDLFCEVTQHFSKILDHCDISYQLKSTVVSSVSRDWDCPPLKNNLSGCLCRDHITCHCCVLFFHFYSRGIAWFPLQKHNYSNHSLLWTLTSFTVCKKPF